MSVVGCELDYDDGLMSLEEAVDRLRQLDIRALVYTSPSNTKTKFKWRILAPFSRALPPQSASGSPRVSMPRSATSSIRHRSHYRNRFITGARRTTGRQITGQSSSMGASSICATTSKASMSGHHPSPHHHRRRGATARIIRQPRRSRSGFEQHLSRMGDGEKSKYDGFNDPLIRATSAYARQHGVDLDRDALKEKLRDAIRAAPKKPERPQHEIDKYLGDKYLDNLIVTAIDKYALKGIVVSANDHWAPRQKDAGVTAPQSGSLSRRLQLLT